MKRFPLTLPAVGSTYPFKIDGITTLRTIESIDLGRGLMFLASNDHPLRPTFINDVVRMVRPNNIEAWLPVLREHYMMDDEGRAALIVEAKENPYSSVVRDQKWLADFTSIESGLYEVMGPVCHNGVDLARAFPQVPNDDLSRDLYTTIGDPVPPLVWPRQESEQSPTSSEVESPACEPGMPHVMRVEDFTVGDRVTVVKKVETLSNGRDAGWEPQWMDETVGETGRVNDVSNGRVLVQMDGDGCEWAYAPEALALENACGEVATTEPASPLSVESTPAKSRAYKIGDNVKVARAVLRDSAGHWCFWTGALEMTIGCTGEVLALVPNETAGAYLYVRVDGHEFYYSPEALDLIEPAP